MAGADRVMCGHRANDRSGQSNVWPQSQWQERTELCVATDPMTGADRVMCGHRANGRSGQRNVFGSPRTTSYSKVPRSHATQQSCESHKLFEAEVSTHRFCDCPVCLCSGYELYFGPGTRLTVVEDGLNITEPNVALFDPSPHEVKERRSATLVCLATKFYPDHVVLSWSVNGVERTEGVKTDEHPTRGSDKMYSLSSRLRLSKKEWLNPQTTFRCKVYFDPTRQNIIKETRGREGCGLTPDSYRQSANTAKFTYLLLIAKTAFYGLLLTMCVMKMKPNNEKIFS
ncbi:hypothetical protein NDU88_000378 [Pleurodeles waltl]|uniref:Ig-like domain-containing protein n=1 Tax=Pleurodeles waltl TaxID=8319 RepID=A0AAV7P0P3_PLEWA|nr:hypothetical protein NDU88_000378 [Pleurodeles waltl]